MKRAARPLSCSPRGRQRYGRDAIKPTRGEYSSQARPSIDRLRPGEYPNRFPR
jgi:hypothetical protein